MRSMRSAVYALIVLLPIAALAAGHAPASDGPAPDAVLKSLRDGNARFVAGKAKHPHGDMARVKETGSGQHPSAVVLGCADSRVPPELIFDQGIGDLFVVRVAGNVSEPQVLGSIEYAAEHLGTRVVVVLGHERCGAVTAAAEGASAEGNIGEVIKRIQPAVEAARQHPGKEGLVHDAIHLHAKNVASQVLVDSPVLKKLAEEGKLKIVPAIYDVESGRVDWN